LNDFNTFGAGEDCGPGGRAPPLPLDNLTLYARSPSAPPWQAMPMHVLRFYQF